jgi:beta-carotene 3-hydroxylase
MFIELIVYPTVSFAVFFLMEGAAWFLHKYVMHGFGWYLHEDHHRYHKGRLEKNDSFGVFFALISFLFILTGILSNFDIKFFIGIGIMFYGFGYFLVHDILFHRRIKIKYRPKSEYMRKVLKAHAIHHGKSSPNAGVNFGFLLVTRRTLLNF